MQAIEKEAATAAPLPPPQPATQRRPRSAGDRRLLLPRAAQRREPGRARPRTAGPFTRLLPRFVRRCAVAMGAHCAGKRNGSAVRLRDRLHTNMVSTDSARLLSSPSCNAPALHGKLPSHATTHFAKSAMRGSRSSFTSKCANRPVALKPPSPRTLGPVQKFDFCTAPSQPAPRLFSRSRSPSDGWWIRISWTAQPNNSSAPREQGMRGVEV